VIAAVARAITVSQPIFSACDRHVARRHVGPCSIGWTFFTSIAPQQFSPRSSVMRRSSAFTSARVERSYGPPSLRARIRGSKRLSTWSGLRVRDVPSVLRRTGAAPPRSCPTTGCAALKTRPSPSQALRHRQPREESAIAALLEQRRLFMRRYERAEQPFLHQRDDVLAGRLQELNSTSLSLDAPALEALAGELLVELGRA